MDPAQQLTLFHFPHSLCSQKVRLSLVEKGVAWRDRIVNIGPVLENYEPWYMRLNPRGVVPTLSHDGEVITDSARIVRYVDEHLPGMSLQPGDPEAHATMEHWIERQDSFPMRELSLARTPPALASIIRRGVARRLRVLAAYRDRTPELARRYQARLDDLERSLRLVAAPGEVAALQRRLDDLLEELDARLDDGRPWIAGDTYSLADVVWTVFLARVHMLSSRPPWAERLPALAAYWRRVRARPSFAKAGIVDRRRPLKLLPHVLPYALPRAAAAVALAGLLGWGAWALLSG